MPNEVTVDMSGLNRFASSLFGALQGGDGDLCQFIRTEAGLLARELGAKMGPKKLKTSEGSIEKSERQFLTVKPEYSTLNERQSESSTADFVWLTAGSSFLLGAASEDNRQDASAGEAFLILRAGQKTGSRGKWSDSVGARRGKGTQDVSVLARTRISEAAFNGVQKLIQGKIGILKASFSLTAKNLLPNSRNPEWWVSRHFASQAKGRSILNDNSNRPNSPEIEFGSSAAGVASNPVVLQNAEEVVADRRWKIAAKMDKIIRGYTYDWNTGGVFRKRGDIIHADI